MTIKRLTLLAVLAVALVGAGALAAPAYAREAHHSHLWHLEHPGGPASGTKWIPLAKYVGWPASACHTLAGVIWNESSGRPWADNGVCRGLTQIHECWAPLFLKVTGHPYFWGIFNPEFHLRFALYIWRVVQHRSFLPAWRGDPAVGW